MAKKKVEEGKSYPITISDWIIFLNGEASTNVSFYAFFITIFIIIIIMYIEFNAIIEGFTKLGAFFIYLLLVFIIGVFAKIINDYFTRPYQELCQKIMEGTITEPKNILEEYYIKEIKKHVGKAEELGKSDIIPSSSYKDMLIDAPTYIINRMLSEISISI